MAEAGRVGELIGTFPGASNSSDLMSFLLLVGAPPVLDPEEIARRCGTGPFERLDVPATAPAPAPAPPILTEAMLDERRRAAVGTVRVGLDKIGNLLDLSGELSLARNALRRAMDRAVPSIADRSARHDTQRALANLDRAVNALGRAALATRLVPVEQLTARLGRAARSIASTLGKEATFEVLGGETEIDKILADALADPLLHLLRNALDHGIESPAERAAAGKPPAGRIVLNAAARGREVVFTLEDDGRGMDPQKILQAARERGILTADAADPEDPLELVFRPGFSTAGSVSELSGRGVGLDVVRSNIGAMKGSVAVVSSPGMGSRFEVVVPITLAIVESLLVRAGGRSFALPTSSVVRTIRAESYRIRVVQGREIVSDEGEAVPLVALARLLGLPEQAAGAARRTIVVAEEGNRRMGFEVEEIEGLLDLVVKPLSDEVPRTREITGTAELPAGDLALTLDARLLLDRAQQAVA
jgi:two-component system chemotaxis sensor kinase CheA